MNETLVCDCCGKGFVRDLENDAYIGNNCFDCSFWVRKINLTGEDIARRVVVEGQHYMVAPEDGSFKGFGGRRFHIRFFDGREIDTGNLWHQGIIPVRFREAMPDNAVFVWAEMAAPTVIDSGIPF
jgi:hypothetical protein